MVFFANIDLRTLAPLDEDGIYASVRKHNKCIVLTEESVNSSFAQSIAGRIQENCFESLDAPVKVMGAANTPAIPLNSTLEATMIPNADKLSSLIEEVLAY